MFAATAGSSPRPIAVGSDAPKADPLSPRPGSPIHVSTEGTTVVITVEHCLDGATGHALLDAATTAVATGPLRLDIDLRPLASYTDDGARSLVSCRELGPQLAEGLHYRTGRGAGCDALLAAFADTDTDDTTE